MTPARKERANIRRRTCPKCKADRVIPIVYGYPSPETQKDAKKGKVSIGGCLVDDSNPEWHCKACGHEWSPPSHQGSSKTPQ